MRTAIDIDGTLLHRAMQASGARTKKAVVEIALRLLLQTHPQMHVQIQTQTSIRKLRGKVQWRGNLSQSRLGRQASQI